MNIYDFVTKEAPGLCGVHPSFGRVAGLVLESEKEGEPEFVNELFETPRERAELALPFKPKDENAYEHCLDIVEYAICYHRQTEHGEDYQRRMDILGVGLNEKEKEMAVRTWWVN